MSSLEELFCQIDDFCQTFKTQWQAALIGNRIYLTATVEPFSKQSV